MKDHAGEPVAAFVAVELDQDAPPVAFVVDEAEQVERLDHAAQLLERPGELRRPFVRLQRAGESRGADQAELHSPLTKCAGSDSMG